MNILFNDIIQYSDAPDELKSPMLSDTFDVKEQIVINLDKPRPINSIGVGNINAEYLYNGGLSNSVYNFELNGGCADSILTEIILSKFLNIIFNDVDNTEFNFIFIDNGLYIMKKTIIASKIIINTNAKTIGRIGAGIGVRIPTSIAKEPAFNSTSEPRITLSGQIIPGLGGYNFRTLSLDSRYKIDEFAMNELINGHKYIGMGYPFFIDLDAEAYKLPFKKFYGIDNNQQNISFEGGIKRFLYSRRFEFRECF